MRRRRTRWSDPVTALRQVTEADIKAELLSCRILQSDARLEGRDQDDADLARHVDDLLDMLLTLRHG